VITAFISPYCSDRQQARAIVEGRKLDVGSESSHISHPTSHKSQETGRFFEVFVDTPLDVCEQRDPKGLYKKARAGEIPQFTGITAPYEAPETPELTLATADTPVEASVDAIVAKLRDEGIIG